MMVIYVSYMGTVHGRGGVRKEGPPFRGSLI